MVMLVTMKNKRLPAFVIMGIHSVLSHQWKQDNWLKRISLPNLIEKQESIAKNYR